MSSDRVIPSPDIPDVVTFTIKTGGSEVDRKYNVFSIRIVKEINKIPFAKITIKDGDPALEDFEISNLDLFIPGKEIEIMAGYRSQESTVFKGIIIKHGIRVREYNASVLVVECRDESVKLTSGRKNKFFYDKTDSDAFDEILGTYSKITASVSKTKVKHEKLVQHYVTDWDFVLSRADANGMLIFVDDNTITIKEPDTSLSPVLTLTYGANMYEFEAEMDARNQLPSVKTKSWDYSNQNVIEKSGNEPSVKSPGNITPADLAKVATDQNYELQHGGQLIDQELQTWADTTLMRSRLSKILGRVSLMGFADIKPGKIIALNGVGKRFNGNAFVSGVRHDINNGEWVTEVQFGLNPASFLNREANVTEISASAVIPAISGLQIGKVVQLENDPEGEDRILVKLPVLDEKTEGLWSRIACLDAGKERGTYFRPEIEDEVVVGFLNDDPREPVVLGMLNSKAKPAPLKAEDINPEKGYVSREKLKMIFNDKDKVFHLETPAGNKITLSEKDKSLTIKDQNNNKIEMTSSGITIESAGEIKIKATTNITVEGVNIDQKASALLSLDGTGGAKLNSSAVTIIKGSAVQIN